MSIWVVVAVILYLLVGVFILFSSTYMTARGRNDNKWWQNVLIVIGYPILFIHELFGEY